MAASHRSAFVSPFEHKQRTFEDSVGPLMSCSLYVLQLTNTDAWSIADGYKVFKTKLKIMN